MSKGWEEDSRHSIRDGYRIDEPMQTHKRAMSEDKVVIRVVVKLGVDVV